MIISKKRLKEKISEAVSETERHYALQSEERDRDRWLNERIENQDRRYSSELRELRKRVETLEKECGIARPEEMCRCCRELAVRPNY